MPEIRDLRREDLPAVGALLAREYSGALPAGREAEFFEDLLCDQPWADARVPSLVAVDGDGGIIGFVAAHARRLRIGGRDVSAACCSHLAVDERHRSTGAGAMLVSRFMAGPQDVGFSDTAIDVVARMWRAAGGLQDPVRSLAWMRVLRPAAWAARVVAGRLGSERLDAGLAPFHPLPLDRGRTRADEAVPGLEVELLTPALAVEVADGPLSSLTLRAPYDEAWLGWLFGRLEAQHGADRVVRRLVRRRGRAIGWYVYVRRPSGAGAVLQVAAQGRDVDAVVAALFAGAREDRVVALTGRLEPHLVEPLRRHRCAVGFDARAVVHTNDAEVLTALQTPSSLLSRLDGEWW
jgi:GNAT superfamily N-acetyltransferase